MAGTRHYPPAPHPVTERQGYITRPWLAYLQAQADVLFGLAGDVSGPASSINVDIAVFSGTTGKTLVDGGMTIAEVIAAAQNIPHPFLLMGA